VAMYKSVQLGYILRREQRGSCTIDQQGCRDTNGVDAPSALLYSRTTVFLAILDLSRTAVLPHYCFGTPALANHSTLRYLPPTYLGRVAL